MVLNGPLVWVNPFPIPVLAGTAGLDHPGSAPAGDASGGTIPAPRPGHKWRRGVCAPAQEIATDRADWGESKSPNCGKHVESTHEALNVKL